MQSVMCVGCVIICHPAAVCRYVKIKMTDLEHLKTTILYYTIDCGLGRLGRSPTRLCSPLSLVALTQPIYVRVQSNPSNI